jgi:hypothetical protein
VSLGRDFVLDTDEQSRVEGCGKLRVRKKLKIRCGMGETVSVRILAD